MKKGEHYRMKNQISLEQIEKFREVYNSDITNKIIENAITKNGLENACINRDVVIENQPIFNIELPESKRYDQKDSWRCWIYGGLNLIKHNNLLVAQIFCFLLRALLVCTIYL